MDSILIIVQRLRKTTPWSGPAKHEVLAAPGCKEIELVNSDQTIDFGFSERNSFSSAHILPERFFFLFGLSLRQSQEQSFSHDEVGWISHNAG